MKISKKKIRRWKVRCKKHKDDSKRGETYNHSKTEKSLVQEKEAMSFIDLEKSLEKVPRERLWDILERRGINKNIKRIIKNI